MNGMRKRRKRPLWHRWWCESDESCCEHEWSWSWHPFSEDTIEGALRSMGRSLLARGCSVTDTGEYLAEDIEEIVVVVA
jgi:hypothetical protein